MTPFAPQLLALIALGGAVGSITRYAVGILAIRWLGAAFPWGTLAVNVAGSAIIGLLGGAIASGLPMSNEMRLLIITGFLGGFTTFSSFSLDTGTLFLRSPMLAAGYVAVTMAGGLLAFGLAFGAMRR